MYIYIYIYLGVGETYKRNELNESARSERCSFSLPSSLIAYAFYGHYLTCLCHLSSYFLFYSREVVYGMFVYTFIHFRYAYLYVCLYVYMYTYVLICVTLSLSLSTYKYSHLAVYLSCHMGIYLKGGASPVKRLIQGPPHQPNA